MNSGQRWLGTASLCLLCSAVSCNEGGALLAPPDGRIPRWTYARDHRSNGPITDGERVYLTNPGGVVALNAGSGEPAWEFNGRLEGFATPAIAITENVIVISWRGTLHGFRADDGVELWVSDAIGPIGSDGQDGIYMSNRDSLARIDPLTGEILWTSDLVETGGIIWAGSPEAICVGRSPIVTVRCYAKSDGSLLWSSGQIDIAPPGGLKIVDSLVLVGVQNTWIAFDLDSGNEVWRRGSLPHLSAATARVNELLYACDWTQGCKAVRSNNGSILWEVSLTDPLSPAASESFIYVIDRSEQNPDVKILDPRTGVVEDSIQTEDPGGFRFPPAYGGGILFAASTTRLYAYEYP
jgi:outer membrane protein assembly factor BamB